MSRLKEYLKLNQMRILVKNFFSLVSVQIASYITPLIVLPYLARVIGVEKFGTVMFAQAIVFYFIAFTNFGFNLYAPREISIVRENKENLTQTFWDIMYSRFFLCVLSILIYVAFVFSIPKFRNEMWVFIFSFGFVIGDVLFPVWFFQGIEKMTYIAVFNFIIKILYVIFIFVFIRVKSDYILVPLLYSFSQIIVGVLSLSIIIFSLDFKPIVFKFRRIFDIFKKSFVLFVSNVSISIYTRIPLVLLGFLAGDAYVGYYSAAEKLFQAWMGIQNQISTTLYPYISKMAVTKSIEETLKFINKTFVITMLVAISATSLTFIFAKSIVSIVYGVEFLESINLLRIFSFVFIIQGIGYVFGVHTLLPFRMFREFTFCTLSVVVTSIILGSILIPVYRHMGAAFTFLSSEVVVSLGMFLVLKYKKIKIIPNFEYIKNFIS